MHQKQAEKLKDEWRMMEDEGWRIISSCWGVLIMDRLTNGICECRVTFTNENCQVS